MNLDRSCLETDADALTLEMLAVTVLSKSSTRIVVSNITNSKSDQYFYHAFNKNLFSVYRITGCTHQNVNIVSRCVVFSIEIVHVRKTDVGIPMTFSQFCDQNIARATNCIRSNLIFYPEKFLETPTRSS